MSVRQMRYGNWVSRRFIVATGVPALAFAALSFVTPLFLIAAIPLLVACAYFAYARHRFSPIS